MTNKEFENEIPKYIKSTESNISKSNRKSKHKHNYEECIIKYHFSFMGKDNLRTQLSSYCPVCGKIGGMFNEEKSIVKNYTAEKTLPNGIKYYSTINGEEIYEQYHDRLPVFYAEYSDKYVNLKQRENE